MDFLDLEKIKVVNDIIKRLEDDFIIDDNFDLLELINQYGVDYILNDFTKLIKKIRSEECKKKLN